MADFDRPSLMVVTPRGTASYPKLNEPDYKFDSNGVYEAKIIIQPDADDAVVGKKSCTLEEFRAQLEELRDNFLEEKRKELAAGDAKAKAKAKKITAKEIGEAAVDDDGDETGAWVLKAKMKASGTTKAGKAWTRSPKIFDAKGALMKNPPSIYGGSVLKLAAKAVPYYMAAENHVGVSLYLEAAQVIELVSGTQRSASAFGFGETDGYVAEDTSDDAPFASDDSAPDDDF